MRVTASDRLIQPKSRADTTDRKIDADIGRRRARRHHRQRRFLEIVGRQHVMLGRDVGLEIGPGAARDRRAAPCGRHRDTRKRSSVSAERLISQAKAGDPAQKMAKKKATNAPVESASTGMIEADRRQ